MKLPIKCPFCNDIMITTFSGDFIIVKICQKRMAHYIEFQAYIKTNDVDHMAIRISSIPLQIANWSYSDNERPLFWVVTHGGYSGSASIFLPFFNPDLSDYKKLVAKIKTYLLFG